MKTTMIIAVLAFVTACGSADESLFSHSGSASGSGGSPVASSSSAAPSSSSAGGGASSSSTEASSSAVASSSAASSSSSGGGFYWKSGVQLGVAKSDMTGWAECYSGLYADTNVPMAQIVSGCPGGKLALGCRQNGSATFQVLAMGDKGDVTFMFPDGDAQSTHVANDVGWYMSGNNWGFVQGNDPLWKGPMDVMGISPNTPGPNGDRRLSWTGNVGSLWVGYRCGFDCNSNHPGFDYMYERVVLSAP